MESVPGGEGEGRITMPALCGKDEHDLVYPAKLGAWAEQGISYHVFAQVCGCDDLAYVVALEKGGARTRVMASLEVVADLYAAIPWIEDSFWEEDGLFEAKRAPSYPALLAYFAHFAVAEAR
jgi:hypothetical protein